MRRTIDGYTYDTDTARLLATRSNDGTFYNYMHFEERLYVTKHERFFFYCAGGKLTEHAKSTNVSHWTAGEKIRPVELAEAVQWCVDHLTVEEFWRVFIE